MVLFVVNNQKLNNVCLALFVLVRSQILGCLVRLANRLAVKYLAVEGFGEGEHGGVEDFFGRFDADYVADAFLEEDLGCKLTITSGQYDEFSLPNIRD